VQGDQSVEQALLELLRDEVNVRQIELIGDESDLVERRVKPLLPVIGPRLGAQIPKVMAAARANDVEYLADGGVRLGGVVLAADEVEILATPRPGTAVAHDEGLVVVVDTQIDDDLRAEGDARELSRAVQDLRKQAALELDESIELWLVAPQPIIDALQPYLPRLIDDTLVKALRHDEPPAKAQRGQQELADGTVSLALVPVESASR
jgi:isoleucyl-tRNA synthetase